MRRFFIKMFACLFVVLVGVKLLDMLTYGFNHPWFPGEDVLTILGAFTVFTVAVMVNYYIVIYEPRKPAVLPEEVE